eukprot:IDg21368t1
MYNVGASIGSSSLHFRRFRLLVYCSWGIRALRSYLGGCAGSIRFILTSFLVLSGRSMTLVLSFTIVTRNGSPEISASLCLLVDFPSEFFSMRKKAYLLLRSAFIGCVGVFRSLS